MKRVLFLFAVIVCFSQSFAQGIVKDKPSPCRFEELSFDFGDIKAGTDAIHNFKFTNTGLVPVTIISVEKSCGMKAVDWTKEAIAPNASGSITINFNTTDREGIFRRTVVVKTSINDGNDILLLIKGNVLNENVHRENKAGAAKLKFSKTSYNFGKLEKGNLAEYEFTFTNDGNAPLIITEVWVKPGSAIKVDYSTETVAPEESATIKVIVDTNKQEGNFDQVLMVRSNDGSKNEKELHVKGRVGK